VVILGGLSLLLVLHLTSRERFVGTFGASLVFAAVMSVGTNVVIEIGMLLGFGTLKNLFTGRYVQPRREQRAFVLIDMRDSTGLAERLGAVPFHELLNDFFRDVSEAALECGAEIHKYVGDEAILTWPQSAVTAGDCLRCPFIAAELIEERRAHYLARYKTVPSFRASLHYGEIVAGEIGEVRREIAYVGDTLNSAARLLEAAKEMGRDVLASADLLAQAAMPREVTAEKLPMLSVRGRAQPLGVSALARA
jgi:adenylate cyclase